MCLGAQVEASVQPFLNPGDPFNFLRLISFQNYGDRIVTIIQRDKKKTTTNILAKGELKILLQYGEDLPFVLIHE